MDLQKAPLTHGGGEGLRSRVILYCPKLGAPDPTLRPEPARGLAGQGGLQSARFSQCRGLRFEPGATIVPPSLHDAWCSTV